jgi:hypothetical protein
VEMFKDPDYMETQLSHLIMWAESNNIDFTKVEATHLKYRAATKINGEVRLIGIGRTLKQCLWMAYKLMNENKSHLE